MLRHELDELLFNHLSPQDFKQIRLLRLRRELEALRIKASDIDFKAEFIQGWLDKYPKKELRADHFHELIDAFYLFIESEGSPFIKAYFREERAIGEKFLSLRKKERMQVTPDPLVNLYKKGPLDIAKGIVQYQFDKMDEWLGLNVFSVDAIFAYAAKYYLNEEVLKWNEQKGEWLLDKLEKGTL